MYVFVGLVRAEKCCSSTRSFEKKIKIDSPENMKDSNQSDCCGCIRDF